MKCVRVFAAACVLAFVSSASQAATIVIDGVLDAAYGPAKSTVAYNPAAPNSNFGAPTNESDAIGYSIYMAGQDGFVYGFMQAAGPGTSIGPFANVYFGIQGIPGGSVLGFEVTNQNAFVPGQPGSAIVPLQYATVGTNVVEFAIPVAYFTGPIAGLPNFTTFGQIGDTVTLRLSQSFGYSVAGGASYGDTRLGTVELTNAVPEPSTWALMILGFFGLAYVSYRRSRPKASGTGPLADSTGAVAA